MMLSTHFKQPLPDQELFEQRRRLFASYRINTVCKSAHCPNQARCLEANTATFMILGDVCSRACLFCAVDKGVPKAVSDDEPYNIARVIRRMSLDYVVITSVSRDDLPDSGAGGFVKVVDSIRLLNPQIKIELLIPDFSGSWVALERIVRIRPECIGHNLETVPRLYPLLGRIGSYARSLAVIGGIKKISPAIVVKSGIMLGLGEEKKEVLEVLEDLRSVNCDIVTLGQYLSPSPDHFPVKRFLDICEFEEYKHIALNLGFKAVLSGPRVRSSYKAKQVYESLHVTRHMPHVRKRG